MLRNDRRVGWEFRAPLTPAEFADLAYLEIWLRALASGRSMTEAYALVDEARS